MIIMLICTLMMPLFVMSSNMILWALTIMTMLMNTMWGSMSEGVSILDNLSFMMVFITIWVFKMSMMTTEMSKKMLSVLWPMMLFLYSSFVSHNYIMFYWSFESAFLMMFLFLMGWGKSPERMEASFYMIFYTLLFSLPLLGLLIMENETNSPSFLFYMEFTKMNQMWVFIFLTFSAKLPLYFTHLWLPKAHVEAPVTGSMILAGVLLKLGGYGIIRLLPFSMVMSFTNFWWSSLFYVSLAGGVMTSVICLRQMDLKMLIAYSSIVHMSMMMTGIMMFSNWSMNGAILMMVAHGLISPAMFFLMSYMYEFFHSRSMMVFKSVMMISPIFCLMWFLMNCLNMGLPPFMSFFSEIFIISGLSSLWWTDWILMIILCFFTGAYCILSFISVFHGGFKTNSYYMDSKTMMITFLHSFYVLIFPMVFFQI